MNNLDQYRQAKASIESLHALAKKDLLSRFQELTREIFQVQRELREEFNVRVTVPSKAPKQPKATRKRAAVQAPASVDKTVAPVVETKTSPTIAKLQKQLAVQKLKLAEAPPSKHKRITDRLYEIECAIQDEHHKLEDKAS